MAQPWTACTREGWSTGGVDSYGRLEWPQQHGGNDAAGSWGVHSRRGAASEPQHQQAELLQLLMRAVALAAQLPMPPAQRCKSCQAARARRRARRRTARQELRAASGDDGTADGDLSASSGAAPSASGDGDLADGTSSSGGSDSGALDPGLQSWSCDCCGAANWPSRDTCRRCALATSRSATVRSGSCHSATEPSTPSPSAQRPQPQGPAAPAPRAVTPARVLRGHSASRPQCTAAPATVRPAEAARPGPWAAGYVAHDTVPQCDGKQRPQPQSGDGLWDEFWAELLGSTAPRPQPQPQDDARRHQPQPQDDARRPQPQPRPQSSGAHRPRPQRKPRKCGHEDGPWGGLMGLDLSPLDAALSRRRTAVDGSGQHWESRPWPSGADAVHGQSMPRTTCEDAPWWHSP